MTPTGVEHSRGHVGVLWGIVYLVPHLVILPVAMPLVVLFVGLPLLLLGWLGLVIYAAGRRPGVLVPCHTCPNRRLPYVKTCPHCGRE